MKKLLTAVALLVVFVGATSPVFAAGFVKADRFRLVGALAAGRGSCTSARRGEIWFTQATGGVADTYTVCDKDATDSYAWVTFCPNCVTETANTVTIVGGTLSFHFGSGPIIDSSGAYDITLGNAGQAVKFPGALRAGDGTPADPIVSGYTFINDTGSGIIHYAARGPSSFSLLAGGVEVATVLNRSILMPPDVGSLTGYTSWDSPIKFTTGGHALTRTTQSGTTYAPDLDGNNLPKQTIVWMSNSSARTVTLPNASDYKDGALLILVDSAGTAGAANISVARSGSDTVNGGTTNKAVVTANFAHTTCIGDGTSAWICGVNN